MALQIIKDLSRLKNQLLNTGLQQKDNPLWQVINQLVEQIQALTNNALSSGSSSSGGNVVINQITQQLGLVGETGDEGIPGPPGVRGLRGLRGLRGYPGIQGDDGSDTESIIMIGSQSSEFVEWSVLTNGDVDFPELIFAAGDVIMTHVP